MRPQSQRVSHLQRYIVTAAEMTAIEARLFAAGMPVAALMEKVAGLVAQRIQMLYPQANMRRVGVLVGPGHNGGDGLVVARELHLSGSEVCLYTPFTQLKELTASHARYAASLGIPTAAEVTSLQTCDLLVDALFGFGLTRPLEGAIAEVIYQVNQWPIPVVSIDLPSGLHTDMGVALGTAVCATHTLCLGLWKRAFLLDPALDYTGQAELIDTGLPLTDIEAVLGVTPLLQRITPETAIAALPLPRSPITHKYKQGHLLVVAGSQQYMGAAILTGLAARASGVGMLSIAVPQSLKSLITAQLPDALVMGCPETETGAIAHLPQGTDLDRYQAIACGPGLSADAEDVVRQVLSATCPLVLDADGLNALARWGTLSTLAQRTTPLILTPHLGEFRRLFPQLEAETDRLSAVQQAAQISGAITLLKGARLAIAHPDGTVRVNPESTPALARGGSGDILTGLLGGLIAQQISYKHPISLMEITTTAVWWHAQAGILAMQERTELGVDATTLSHYLIQVVRSHSLK